MVDVLVLVGIGGSGCEDVRGRRGEGTRDCRR